MISLSSYDPLAQLEKEKGEIPKAGDDKADFKDDSGKAWSLKKGENKEKLEERTGKEMEDISDED